MKLKAIKQFITDVTWGDLDYFIIDSPPGTGDEPLTIAQQIPGSKSIIVTTPQAVSILDVRKSINFCRRLSMPVFGLIENMSGLVCPYCGKSIELFGSGGGKKAATDMGIPYLDAIPVDPEITKSDDAGKPIVMSQPESEAARAINRVAQLIIDDAGTEMKKL
jgi:Mrp family chromosome partitioning ATPase